MTAIVKHRYAHSVGTQFAGLAGRVYTIGPDLVFVPDVHPDDLTEFKLASEVLQVIYPPPQVVPALVRPVVAVTPPALPLDMEKLEEVIADKATELAPVEPAAAPTSDQGVTNPTGALPPAPPKPEKPVKAGKK